MAQPILRPSCLVLLGIVAAASLAIAQVEPDTTPKITSVSKVTTAKHQTITITGTGFGTHAHYTGNSNYISFYDQTKGWEAGYKPDGDTVTLIVNSWTNTKITLGGFAGLWGTHNFTLGKGNKEKIRIWNAQTKGGPFGLACTAGCVTKTVTIVAAPTATEVRSSPNPSVFGEPVTLFALVTSGDGVPPDGGKVVFMKGAEVLGSGTLRSGVARFATSTLEFGDNSIKAVYEGDSDFARTGSDDSDSMPLTHKVN